MNGVELGKRVPWVGYDGGREVTREVLPDGMLMIGTVEETQITEGSVQIKISGRPYYCSLSNIQAVREHDTLALEKCVGQDVVFAVSSKKGNNGNEGHELQGLSVIEQREMEVGVVPIFRAAPSNGDEIALVKKALLGDRVATDTILA